MSDKPILMSGPMVRAILREIERPGAGKTQTRRVLTAACDEPPAFVDDGAITALNENEKPYRWPRTYAVGDRLWVREAWWAEARYNDRSPKRIPTGAPTYYQTDPEPGCAGRYRAARFMCRWMSRMTLIATDVRVQPLLDISEDDARAEGFSDGPLGDPIPETDIGGGWSVSSPGGWASAAGHFQVYWSHLHPEWDGFSSPWVLAITFQPHLCNIDSMPKQEAP